MPGALAGVHVLEIGEGKPLAYAGKLLRDLGAEVVKAEPPEGDALRRYGPFPGDEPDPERSGLFLYLNAGKGAVQLRPDDTRDREAFERLLEDADVLLHSYQPSLARALGLDYGALGEAHPRLVVAAVTPFGSTGPSADWKAYSINAYAGTGVGQRVGSAEREPLNAPLDGAEMHHAAPQLALAVVLALLDRDRSGRGQFVDVGTQEAVNFELWGHTMNYAVYLGHPPLTRPGPFGSAGGVWGNRRSKDGHVVIMTQLKRHWQEFLDELGHPEWTQDWRIEGLGEPNFIRSFSPEDNQWVRQAFRDHLDPWLQARTSEEIWAMARRRRISFHPILTVPQVCASDQADARGLLVELPGTEPPLRIPRAPYLMTRTPALPPGRAPRLDDAPAERWASTPRAPDPEHASTGGEPGHGAEGMPLAGLRVLDLGQVWAGPLVGRYLADYGADVVSIRTASRPPTVGGSTDPESPVAWEWIYRNKRSLALNFGEPEAVSLFWRLAAVSDVVVDNFSPRAMPRMGLGYDELTAANPRLIMVALPPAGRGGPWADLVTYGPSLEGLYGMKSLNGYPESRQLTESAAELDPTSVGYATLAVLAALYHRNRSGEGQFIELAQGEAGFAGIAEAVIEYVWNGRELGPLGNTHRVLAPHGWYPCSGDDQWITIACGSDEEWRALAEAAGHREWLTRGEWAAAAGRREARLDLDAAIGEWTAPQDKWELAQRLQDAGVACFPALDQLEVVSDPQLCERREHFELHDDFSASQLLNGNAWHLSRAHPRLRMPAVELGTHNAAVLDEYLGVTKDEVRRLEAAGVLA